MGWRITHRGFVDTWDCDENEHLNMQFYVSRFSDATAHLFAALDVPPHGPAAPRLVARHVRYHRELRVAALTEVASARVDAVLPKGADLALVHRLSDPSRGFLAATAIDYFALARPEACNALAAVALPEEAEPRSHALEPETETRSEAELRTLGYLEVDRTILRAGAAGMAPDGTWTPESIIARVSDGMGFVYELVGLTRAVVDDLGRGRVSIELVVSPMQAVAVGTPIVTLAGLVEVARSTFTIRDVIFDALTGRAVAVVRNTALMMDLARRKSVPFDAETRARMEQALVQIAAKADV